MLIQCCNIFCKYTTTVVVIAQRYASKGKKPFVSNKRKNIQRNLEKLRLKEKLKENVGRTPIITTKRKEYNFYVGDKFNKFEAILITRGWMNPKSNMDYFTIHCRKDKPVTSIDNASFENLNLSEKLIENLQNKGIKSPTEIQLVAIPKLINNKNTIIAAETGSGKTLAYLLPLVQQIIQWKENTERGLNCPLGLIITPSRELTNQIGKEAIKLSYETNIKTKVLIGGRIKRLMRNPPIGKVDILVASLGALSKLVTNKVYSMDFIRHVILDEADSLFDCTFHEKLIPFLQKIDFANTENTTKAQLTLASATMPSHIAKVLCGVINVDTFVTASTKKLHFINVPQKFLRIGPSQKPMYLLKLIKSKAKTKKIIIFTNNSETCNWLSTFLKEFNVNNVSLNGNMGFNLRKDKFIMFNSNQINILCSTDAGSRGLDTVDVTKVINYDFPLQTAEYIHRCGRTGRVGSPKDCNVISFITTPIECILARKIEIAIRKGLPIPIIDMFNQNNVESTSLIDEIDETNQNKNNYEIQFNEPITLEESSIPF